MELVSTVKMVLALVAVLGGMLVFVWLVAHYVAYTPQDPPPTSRPDPTLPDVNVRPLNPPTERALVLVPDPDSPYGVRVKILVPPTEPRP